MTRTERNELINKTNDPEKAAMIRVSALLGDDEYIDIDWDELIEAIGWSEEALPEVECLLQSMYDQDILNELDFCEGVLG